MGAVRTAVYRLFDSSGTLLYIGISEKPKQRFQSHANSKDWWPNVARHTIEWCDDRPTAEAAEVAAIHAEAPLYNRDDNPWAPPKPPLGPNEVSSTIARANMGDLLKAVRILCEIKFLVHYGKRQAALVPTQLGEMAERVGGVEKACAILAAAAVQPERPTHVSDQASATAGI